MKSSTRSWTGKMKNSVSRKRHQRCFNMDDILDVTCQCEISWEWQWCYGYVRVCPCSWEIHAEIVRSERSWSLQFICKWFNSTTNYTHRDKANVGRCWPGEAGWEVNMVFIARIQGFLVWHLTNIKILEGRRPNSHSWFLIRIFSLKTV